MIKNLLPATVLLSLVGCVTVQVPATTPADTGSGNGLTEVPLSTGNNTDGDTGTAGDTADTVTDTGTTTTVYFYRDDDLDGYGKDSTKSLETDTTHNWTTQSGDCDDTNADVNPGVNEVVGNGIDDDCNSATGDSGTNVYYLDADGDGFGKSSSTTTGTSAPAGYVSNSTDCLDTDKFTFPGAAELSSTTLCETDADGDGYGSMTPVTGVTAGTDCLDSDSTVHPGATEVTGNGKDDDCNTATSDTASSSSSTCASTDSLVTATFTMPVGSTLSSISGMAMPASTDTNTYANEFGWTVFATGTPSGMTVTQSTGSGSTTKNVVTASYANCINDATEWNLSVTYTSSSGAVTYDCHAGAFTGTWSVMRDSTVDTATVSNNSSTSCDMVF